jgi:hypothetical protein
VSDPNDNSIPVLQEILVPGRAPQTRDASSGAAATPAAQPAGAPAPQAAPPLEPGVRHEPALAPPPAPAHPAEPASEPVLAPQPVLTPQELASPEPVLAPQPLSESRPAHEPASTPARDTDLYPPHVADHTHAKKRPRPHHGVHVRHGHEGVHEEMEVSPGVFDRGEPDVPLEAGTTVPPDFDYEAEHDTADGVSHDATREGVAPQLHLDADVIAERLRERFAGFLAGDARSVIEARCRDALQQHTSLLVGQITAEVVRTLEAEMTGWVREAVADEIARRSGRE